MSNLIPSGVTPEQLANVQEVGRDHSGPAAYEGPVYKTELVNKRDDPAVLWEGGKELIKLRPKSECFIESWSAHTSYAPYSKVTFERNGRLSLTKRHGFPDLLKAAPFVLELINIDGASSESIRVNDAYVEVVRDIPRRVAVWIGDPLVVYKKIVWKKRTVKEPIPGNKNYLTTRTIIEKQLVPRKSSEIRKIKKILADQSMKEARESTERRFHGIVGGPEVDDEADIPTDA